MNAPWQTGDIANINPGLPAKKIDTQEVSFLPMNVVQAVTGKYELFQNRKMAEVKKGYTPFIDGDVIFAKITPCMENGKIAVLTGLKNGVGFGSTEFHVSRPLPGIDPRYLFYYFVQSRFREDARRHMTGSAGQLRVSTEYFKSCTLPIAASKEQREVIAKIEELFSDLDNAIENLKKAQEQLKVYRQAVLKSAFEGRLTNVVKESNLREIKINGLPANLHLTQNVKRLGEYVKLQGGFAFKSKEYTVEGLPIVKITNVHYGDIDWSDKTFIDSSRYGEFKDYQLREGDVLVAMTRPIIKSLNTVKTVIVKKRDLPSLLNQRVGRFILSGEIYKDYLKYFLYTDYFKQRVIRESSSTQQPNISSKNIEDFDFIVPENKAAQEMIVKQIELRFSLCDQLEATINDNLQRSEVLRQSILKQAFEGKLTEQWRKEHKDLISGENSAEALLKKIKAEKEALNNEAKRKRYGGSR